MDEHKYMRHDEILKSWWPQSIALHLQFSIIIPQISLIQPQFSIFNSSSSILSQKNGIFYSKSPQNSMISDKMSASAACTACNFFLVCFSPHTQTWKKLQAVQAALPDILSEIMLFWELFESIIPLFWLKMEEEELEIEKWGWIKEIWGKRMEKEAFRSKNWGWRAMNLG